MSDSNFLNVEEIILFSSCLFKLESFYKKPFKTFKIWSDFPLFIKSVLNTNIFSIVFGIEYYQQIIEKRNSKKNLVAASLFVDCLKGLLQFSLNKGKYVNQKDSFNISI